MACRRRERSTSHASFSAKIPIPSPAGGDGWRRLWATNSVSEFASTKSNLAQGKLSATGARVAHLTGTGSFELTKPQVEELKKFTADGGVARRRRRRWLGRIRHGRREATRGVVRSHGSRTTEDTDRGESSAAVQPRRADCKSGISPDRDAENHRGLKGPRLANHFHGRRTIEA